MIKWQNPLLTLGERCVAFAENEMNNGVKEDHPNSFTSPRIREYFSICTRKTNGKEVPVSLPAGNWCAASASFCLKNSLLPGEIPPHGYRLGVVEIVNDAQEKRLWNSITAARGGSYELKIGDAVVFDRSNPSNPASAWWRHIGRVYDTYGTTFRCISGNNGGTWKISSHTLSQANILGFCECVSTKAFISSPLNWSTVDVSQLAPLQDTGDNLSSDDFYSIYDSVFKK